MKFLLFLTTFIIGSNCCAYNQAPYKICKADKNDLDACTAICASPTNAPHLFPEFGVAQLHTYLKNAQENSRYKFFVTKLKNKIVGIAICFAQISNEWNLDILAVKPNCQHQGIGSILLGKIKELSRETKMPVSAMVKQSNQKAINCYLKQQFNLVKQYGSDPACYQEHKYLP